jgi:hypothetical protein
MTLCSSLIYTSTAGKRMLIGMREIAGSPSPWFKEQPLSVQWHVQTSVSESLSMSIGIGRATHLEPLPGDLMRNLQAELNVSEL